MKSQLIIMSEHAELNKENKGIQTNIQLDSNQVAVFIHLHYIDSLDKYFQYINIIPDDVIVYVSTSNSDVESKIREYAFTQKKKKIVTVPKKNRGRDITAFLVAFRKIVIQYKYICFLHDKKEKRASHKEDVEQWIDSLWGNLLGTKNSTYFWKIISLFEEDGKLGLLAPPEPMGASFGFENAWYEPYISLTKILADDLNLQADINMDIDQQPITLGTCFWARKDALSKLISKNWKYEDFDDEPIPIDGKCYAVERILGYVAEDAGYCVNNIMTEEYAGRYMRFLIECRRRAFRELKGRYAITTLGELRKLDEMCQYFDCHKATYLYGAGKVGKGLCTYLCDKNRYPQGFIVSERNHQKTYLDFPVRSIDEIYQEEDIGIIVSVAGGKTTGIVNELARRGIDDYFCVTQ